MEIRLASDTDMPSVFALRFEVFVDEQNVPPEIELDAEDKTATHIIAYENGTPVGCGRVIISENEGHLGRLAVKKNYRGSGIGSAICRFMTDLCTEHGCSRIWLNSQLHAKEFYKRLGFSPVGEVFTEAGIEHIQMEIVNLI